MGLHRRSGGPDRSPNSPCTPLPRNGRVCVDPGLSSSRLRKLRRALFIFTPAVPLTSWGTRQTTAVYQLSYSPPFGQASRAGTPYWYATHGHMNTITRTQRTDGHMNTKHEHARGLKAARPRPSVHRQRTHMHTAAAAHMQVNNSRLQQSTLRRPPRPSRRPRQLRRRGSGLPRRPRRPTTRRL